MQISMGSASELEYFLVLASDLGYLGQADHELLARDLGEVKRMLSSLIVKLRR